MTATELSTGTDTSGGTGSSTGIDSSGSEDTAGSAGGLIGKMGNGTVLEVTNADSAVVSATINGVQHAGGIVGECESAAVILNNCKIRASVSAGNGSAGGIIGSASDTTITSSSVSVESLTANGANAGGLFGSYTQTEGGTFTPALGITIPSKVTVSGSSTAGGLFGCVELKGNACVTVGEDGTSNVSSELTGGITGGVAGQVTGEGTTDTLTVKNYSVDYEKTGAPTHLGGVIGLLGRSTDDENTDNGSIDSGNTDSTGAATLVLNRVTTTTSTPSVANAEERNFGGAVGRLEEESVLDAKNVTIITTGQITSGGAIVGNARPGSAVRLSEVTDLSNVQYTESANVGQLIGYQESSLIYALGSGSDYNETKGSGWTLKRPKTPYALDDIGNYGEVFRLKAADDSSLGNSQESTEENSQETSQESTGDLSQEIRQGISNTLIQMNETTHKVTLSGSIEYTNIATVDDFARLAIIWQTKGYFSGDSSIQKDNWTDLNAKSITITDDINLAGTGITGLTRDTDMESVYNGMLNGGNHTITLAIGEAYGVRGNAVVTNDTEGSGKIYRHGRLGLFAAANGSVSNLKIAGNIEAHAKSEMAVGGYAAYKTGNSEVGYTVSGVEISPALNIKADDKTAFYVGGMYGIFASDGVDNDLTFESNSKAAANISLGSAPTDYTHIGGAIGAVSEKSVTNIVVTNLTIGGSISSTVESEYCYAGGFIGTIWPSSTSDRSKTGIVLQGLKIENFSLTEGSTESAGGFLGYCWADTDVTFTGVSDTAYGLSVNSSSVIAENCKNLGGLVYRAGGGMWKVSDYGIDMSGAVINGGTTSLGILANYGFTSNVKLNGFSKNVASLYLNNTTYWGTAYQVAGCSITSTPNIFDEWVAYSAATASSICDNGKGIISLTTQNGTVTMDGTDTNTYVNRTDYGKNCKTNNTSRYYYNIEKIRTELMESTTNNNGCIDTPQELLMWSVCHYTDSKLRTYIRFADAPYKEDGSLNSGLVVGSASETNCVVLDMRGYSYYPINLTDLNLTVKNASIIFYAKEIAEGEKNNKTNIGTENSHTQHYIMHCGLLRNYYGSTTSVSTTSCTLNVKNVTLEGNVGVVNKAWSGALICGSMKGISGRTSVVSIDELNMDGLSVYNPENIEVYPLLINCAYSYVTLNLTKITGLNLPNKAASSLIGGVGIPSSDTNGTGVYKDATQLALTFSKIKLPDTEGAFTRATLLESFRYNEGMVGSATYNFYKAEDQNHEKVTYGKEITETKEYPDMQLWYYDAGTYKQEAGLVFEGNATASGYLPYVQSEYTEGRNNHEIKVNQRTTDIIVGCGSYGDPYVITEAETMQAIAAYMINPASMPDHITLVDMQEDTTETNGGFELCTGSKTKHRTYEKDGSSWVEVEKDKNNE